jgi:hypothetical protein
VVWHSNGQDGDSYGVFGRRLNAAGAALATEFQERRLGPTLRLVWRRQLRGGLGRCDTAAIEPYLAGLI